jgi:hypothetical protein
MKDPLRRHPWIASLLFNAFAFALTYTLFEAGFQTNDDTDMMLTVSGLSTVSEASRMLIFSHVLIGDALVRLYSGWPTVPWYAIYLTLALYAGHSAILGTALYRRPSWKVLAVYCLLFVLLSAHILLQLQFTIASSVLAIGAFSLLTFFPFPKQSNGQRVGFYNWLPILVGVLLALLSGMIRWNSELMVASLFFPLLLVVCVGLGKREAALRAFLFVGVLSLSALLHQANQMVYEYSPGWKEHFAFNQVRAEFTDYGARVRIKQSGTDEILESVGWSKNDLVMLSRNFFIDSDVYSLEKISTVAGQLPAGYRPNRAAKTLAEVVASPLGHRACLLWLLCFLLAEWRWRSLLISVGAPLGVAILLAALAVWMRNPPTRIVWPLLIFMATCPLMFMAKRETEFRMRKLRLVVVSIVALLLISETPAAASTMSRRSFVLERDYHALKTILHKISPQPDQLFVVWSGAFPWRPAIRPFEVPKHLRNFRVLSLGPYQRTPNATKVLSEFKIHDLYLSLGQRKEIFFVVREDNADQNLYSAYMQEHYGRKVTWNQRGKVGRSMVGQVVFAESKPVRPRHRRENHL